MNESIGTLAAERLKALDTSFDELDDAAGKLFLKFKSDLAPAFMTIIDLATKFVDSVGGRRIRNKAQELDPEAFREAESKIIKDFLKIKCPKSSNVDINIYCITSIDICFYNFYNINLLSEIESAVAVTVTELLLPKLVEVNTAVSPLTLDSRSDGEEV